MFEGIQTFFRNKYTVHVCFVETINSLLLDFVFKKLSTFMKMYELLTRNNQDEL